MKTKADVPSPPTATPTEKIAFYQEEEIELQGKNTENLALDEQSENNTKTFLHDHKHKNPNFPML